MPAPVRQGGTTLTPTTAANAVVTWPSGIQAGDVIVVYLYKENAAAVTLPGGGGWTEKTGTGLPATVSGDQTQHVFWYRSPSGGESGTVTFSWTGSVFREAAAERYSSCIASGDPIELVNGTNTATSVSSLNITLNGTSVNTLLVWIGTCFTGGATWTPPSGFTESSDQSEMETAWKTNTAGGNIGNTSGTATVSGPFTSVLISLLGASDAVAPLRFLAGQTWKQQFKHLQILPFAPTTTVVAVSGDSSLVITDSITAAGAATGSASVATTASITATGNMDAAGSASEAITATISPAGAATGSASVATTASITAAGNVATSSGASLTITATITASSNPSAGASLTITDTITATGNMDASGSASRATTASITAAGTATGSASVATTASITAAGNVATSSGASLTVTVTITASSSPSAGASLTVTDSITATGAATGSASRATTAGVTTAGTATGSAAVATTASITAAGVASYQKTASLVMAATIAAVGQAVAPPQSGTASGAIGAVATALPGAASYATGSAGAGSSASASAGTGSAATASGGSTTVPTATGGQ